jgi:hypothetical protein
MGEITTFYSYKGGVGRTMALANVAVLLSKWGYQTLMVDWDLEAPGLEFYFRNYLDLEKTTQQEGVVELLRYGVDNRAQSGKKTWQDLILGIALVDNLAPLHLLTAGSRNEGYFSKVRNLDLQTFYDEREGGLFIESLRNEWKQAYDYVLIDSRTGITDIGGVCTVQLPDILALLFTANEQSMTGVVDVAKRAQRARQELPFDRHSLLLVPVPSRFDSSEEFGISQGWLDRFNSEVSPLYANWLPKGIDRRAFLEVTKIPYMAYFSFGEKLPVLEHGTNDPAGLGYAYETLAALIANNLGYAELLPRNRGEFVELASRTKTEGALEPSRQADAVAPGIHRRPRAQQLGNRMILAPELSSPLRDTLLKCSEFHDDTLLRAVFVTSELVPYRYDLPQASNMSERVDKTIDYLLQKRAGDDRPPILPFLSLLRDRLVEGDALRDELAALNNELEQALSNVEVIGETVDIPFAIVAMTRDEATHLFSGAIFDDPAVAPLERERFQCFSEAFGSYSILDFLSLYGEHRDDWMPYALSQSTIQSIVLDVTERINRTNSETSNLQVLRPRFLSADLLSQDRRTRVEVWAQLRRSGYVLIVDAVSLFHPVLRQTFSMSQLDSNERAAVAVLSPVDGSSGRVNKLIETLITSHMELLFSRFSEDLDRLVEIGISDSRALHRWLFAVLPEMRQIVQMRRLSPINRRLIRDRLGAPLGIEQFIFG